MIDADSDCQQHLRTRHPIVASEGQCLVSCPWLHKLCRTDSYQKVVHVPANNLENHISSQHTQKYPYIG